MKYKKLLAAVLSAGLALSLAACGGSDESSAAKTTVSGTQEASTESTTQASAKVNEGALSVIASDLSRDGDSSTGSGAIQASTSQGYEVGYLDENNNYICPSLGYQLTGGTDFEFFDINSNDITEDGESDRQDEVEKSFKKNHVAIEVETVSDDTMVIVYVIDPLYSISESSSTVAANIAENSGLKDTGETRNITVLGTSDTVRLYTDGSRSYAIEKIASTNGIYSLVEVISVGDVQNGFDLVQTQDSTE